MILTQFLSANEFAGKMERPVLYQSKNKGPLQKRPLLNRVSHCSTGGRGAIRNAAFASASPATPSRLPYRVLFEILRQKLNYNEFPALQSVFSDFSTGLQSAFAFRYPAQHEQDPKESMKASISKIFDILSTRAKLWRRTNHCVNRSVSFPTLLVFKLKNALSRWKSRLKMASI
jgi:hypothetical protein